MAPKLLFCSCHCYGDPSSGAALCMRDLLEILTARGWRCGVFCGPLLDFEDHASLDRVLGEQQLPFERRPAAVGTVPFTLVHYEQGGIPVTIYDLPHPHPRRLPSRAEGQVFLALYERVLERVRPDVLVTYGGSWPAEGILAYAKRRGIPIVSFLHNCAYLTAEIFRPADAVFVLSRFAQAYYQRTLRLACTVVPAPLSWSRVQCATTAGRYVTFVNPQPDKGVFLFARIAYELGRRRPDIPLLVVEGRGRATWLQRTGLDLRGRTNLYVMRNTPDPRDYYRVSRLVLMPSLCQETFGRVAAAALVNGIPVLASRRGALPEVLAQAGFLFDVPACYTPESRAVPSEAEVAPWVEMITRLWDDAAFYEQERQRCRAAAEVWRPERCGARFEELVTLLFR